MTRQGISPLPLQDIAALLLLWRDRNRASQEIKARALAHIENLRRKAAELDAMAESLQHPADSCDGDERPDCPVLTGFSRAGDQIRPA